MRGTQVLKWWSDVFPFDCLISNSGAPDNLLELPWNGERIRLYAEWRISLLVGIWVESIEKTEAMDPWMGYPVKGESVFTLLKFAVLPIAKVLVMCALGLLLPTRTVNILPANSRKQLSKVRFLTNKFAEFWFQFCSIWFRFWRPSFCEGTLILFYHNCVILLF